MCGRFTLHAADDDLSDFFDFSDAIACSPRYNIAPSQDILAVRTLEQGQKAKADRFHWGLVPTWAKDRRAGYGMINARAETVREKPAFRAAFRQRRCLIPASGYFEWKPVEKRKQPFLISRPDQGLLAFAGLWERWRSPEGEILESCTILTTESTPRLAEIHGRMPLILSPEHFESWLDPAQTPPEELLAPYPHDDLQIQAVSTLVNNVANDDPRCIEPIVETPQLDLL